MNWNDHLFQPNLVAESSGTTLGPEWSGVRFVVTKAGPVHSERPYGLNLGVHVGDDAEQVQTRRQALSSLMGAPIVWLNQVHGTEVFHADEVLPNASVITADASVTTSPDVALAIMTADCLPALFVARNANGSAVGVGAAHAGWRGLYAGVLERTVHELACRTGTTPESISAFLGPCIGPKSFEVGQEVFDAFVEAHPAQAACFEERKGLSNGQPDYTAVTEKKYLGDLPALARMALQRCGVHRIHQSELDTFTNLDFFSHRRGQQQGLPAGRFASLIRLLPWLGA